MRQRSLYSLPLNSFVDFLILVASVATADTLPIKVTLHMFQ